MDPKDMDVASLYPQMILSTARGCGKSLYQLALYEHFWKESKNMSNEQKIDFKVNPSISFMPDFTPPWMVDPNSVRERIEIKKPEEAPEEWVWIKGYKGTNKDMRCRDYTYELNKQFNMDEDAKIEVCDNGFHLCKELKNVFGYYDVGGGNRFFEVSALVRKKDDEMGESVMSAPYGFKSYFREDKFVAKSIIFVRELDVDEVFASLDPDQYTDWTHEDKVEAMKTGTQAVRNRKRKQKLVKLGYSEPFAAYLASNGKFDVAYAVGSQPNLSMDMKCLFIFEGD